MKTLLLTLVALAVLALPGAALARDRDRDGLPDRWERKHNLSTSHKSANKDPDRDKVDNGNEFRERTHPRDGDTDGDGRRDGREDADRDRLRNAAEDATGNDPRDRDTDGDGVRDGRERAGVVASYVNDTLTIDLANGGLLRGRVSDETRMECNSESELERRYRGGARTAQWPEDEEPFEPGEDEGALDPGEEDEDDPPDDEWPDDIDDPFDTEQGDDAQPGDGGSCLQDSLLRGAAVHEASLAVTPDGVGFFSVKLVSS